MNQSCSCANESGNALGASKTLRRRAPAISRLSDRGNLIRSVLEIISTSFASHLKHRSQVDLTHDVRQDHQPAAVSRQVDRRNRVASVAGRELRELAGVGVQDKA